MRFRVTFAPTADLSFPRLPRWARERFNDGFDWLEADPRQGSGPIDIHQLYGYRNVWTWRVPPFRAVYAIDGYEVVMIIFGHRDNVYQELHSLLPPRRQEVTGSRQSQRR